MRFLFFKFFSFILDWLSHSKTGWPILKLVGPLDGFISLKKPAASWKVDRQMREDGNL